MDSKSGGDEEENRTPAGNQSSIAEPITGLETDLSQSGVPLYS
jgi:hypothetical protein